MSVPVVRLCCVRTGRASEEENEHDDDDPDEQNPADGEQAPIRKAHATAGAGVESPIERLAAGTLAPLNAGCTSLGHMAAKNSGPTR
jgi:hypothetical protein